MAKIEINRITNANIYLDGANLLGRAEEVKLPDVSMTMQEHKALGMVGKVELPAGFDKMEGEIGGTASIAMPCCLLLTRINRWPCSAAPACSATAHRD